MPLLRLASWISARHLRDQLGRTMVSILGVALGVSMFVAIRLSSGSAITAFRESVDALAGPANLQIQSSAEGVDESKFAQISKLSGVKSAWPVIQVLASNADDPALTLLVVGVDFSTDPRLTPQGKDPIAPETLLRFITDPESLAVSKSFAEKAGWKTGNKVKLSYAGRIETFTVRLVMPDEGIAKAYGGDVGVLDIASAQEKFGKLGRLSRIDLIAEPKKRTQIIANIRQLLPSASVAPPVARGSQVEQMIASFRLNLLALALVALFVGAFLIFNSVSLSVIQRRREIGIARSVGVSRAQILWLFVGEALVYGLAGSILGLALGILLAEGALASVSGTVSTMYAAVKATQVVLDAGSLFMGFSLGMLTALLSGLIPAIEAASTPPGVASREGSIIQKRKVSLFWIACGSAVFAILGVLSAHLALENKLGMLGFASAGLLLISSALASPVITVFLSKLVVIPAKVLGGIEGVIAARWLVQSLERTSVVIAALAASVTMLIALNMMVGSFRRTVEVWMEQTVRADIFVEPASRLATGEFSALPKEVLEIMNSLPGTLATDALRANQVIIDGKIADLYSIDYRKLRDHSRLLFIRGDSADKVNRALADGSILVSETFQSRFGKGEGDLVQLNTPAGQRSFRIEGVFYDYTTEGGLILMHRPQYAAIWNDDIINTAAIYIRHGFDPEEVRADLQRRLVNRFDVAVLPNRALKDRALKIFDSTFAITNSLKIVAVVIAVLGVLTAMSSLILQRKREIGMMRSVGAHRNQVGRMTVIESCLIGVFGTVIGMITGPIVAQVLIRVINKLFFGWTIIPTVDLIWFLESAAWVIGASVLAGAIPARFAMRLLPAEVVRDER